MSNPLYQDMQAIAAGVLAEFDQKSGDGTDADDGLWYIKITPGAGPSDNPGTPTETPYKANGAARGVSFKYIGTQVRSGTAAGSTIVATDLQCVLAVDPRFTPEITGFIKADGTRYKIVEIMAVPPVGVTVAHRIIFRK